MSEQSKSDPLATIVQAQHTGKALGIYSVCSANWFVLEAALRHALAGDWPLLVESTCNQVNQDGGYTGLTPQQFMERLQALAREVAFPAERLVVGGDHLGPSPWQQEPATEAMAKAHALVRDYVLAGYQKIHLDASMKLGDDDPAQPLAREVSAGRAADLAAVAEAAYRERREGLPPRYVIGTEVPIPGGAQEAEATLTVSDPQGVAATISLTREAFQARGLEDAWERVIAVVVQPGVEFGDESLFAYERAAARPLTTFIEQREGLVYEAHSTDYQTPVALRQLVEDHFAILKVGPALTFAFREAVYALDMIEREMVAAGRLPAPANLRETLERAMADDPAHWRHYYEGDPAEQRFKRHFSFSDRSRYYWPVPAVTQALAQLLHNLEEAPPSLSLLSQFLPRQYEQVRAGALPVEPQALIMSAVGDVLDDYAYASGYIPTPG